MERLLPSPPPKWAEASSRTCASLFAPVDFQNGLRSLRLSGLGDEEHVESCSSTVPSTEPSPRVQRQSSSSHLGRWARGSKVGAQVRSASDLGGPARRGSSQRTSQALGSQVRSASTGSFPSCSPQRELLQSDEVSALNVQLDMQLEHLHQVGPSEAATASQMRKLHLDHQACEQNFILEQLHRDSEEPSEAHSAQGGQRGTAVLTSDNCYRGPPPDRRPLALRPLPPKPRSPPPLFSEAGSGHARASTENIPPHVLRAAIEAASADKNIDATAARIHSDVQRLCVDVMCHLPVGPESIEVGALLRRVGAILCPAGTDT